MADEIRCVVSEAFDLTFATAPLAVGATVTLEALYGVDGVDVGQDDASVALVFPVTLTEGADGVYSTDIILSSQGPFWARFSVGGAHVGISIIRVVAEDAPAEDVVSDVSYTVAVIVPTEPATMQIGLHDSAGAVVGVDASTAPYTYPQSMAQVTGYADCWYFTPVSFSEGGRVQVKLYPPTGPSYSDVLVVRQAIQAGVLAHFNGWVPDAGYDPNAWVSLYYIRKWTGWTTSHVSDEDLRELRRTAIETFIGETNVWAAAWEGTWYSLRGQGRRLYLPVPLILPSGGGSEPVVRYVEPWGDQTEVESIDNDYLTWRVRGMHTKQPFLEWQHGRGWEHTLDVAITGTWGFIGPAQTQSIKVMQTVVGLIRWHSLSFGVDADDARDQSTLNRIAREGTRDASVMYHDSAIGMGITGDKTVDRALTEFRIHPGPWVRRGGDLP